MVNVSSDEASTSLAGRSTRCAWMQPLPVALKVKLARRPAAVVVNGPGFGSTFSVVQLKTFSPATGTESGRS